VACVYCHVSAMSGLKGGLFIVHDGALSTWHDSWMLRPFGHVLHVLKPMYIINRRSGCCASDAFLFAEQPIT
jgi:hypothetical protein